MVKTEVYKDGRSLGYVIWSGFPGEAPINFRRFFEARCFSADFTRG